MIDVQLHFHGTGTKRHKMPCLPRPSDYLTSDGRLWKVDSVVFAASTARWGKQPVSIYCIPVADDR